MTRHQVQLSLCTLIGIAGLAHAAAQAEGEARYSYSGSVINTATGEAVTRAQIQLTRIGPVSLSAPGFDPRDLAQQKQFSAAAFSDAAGMFRFEGLPAGSYRVQATKPEFLFERAFDRRANGMLVISSSIEGATVRLSPLGVIAGKVTGDDGLPLRHIKIVALTAKIMDGLRLFSAQRNVSTDDRGIYRIWNLHPGDYYIKAAGRSGGTITYPGDQPPISSDYESFAPVYFGGTNSLASATPIKIKAGSNEQADLTLTLSPSFKIRGRLLNFAQGEPVHFELLSGDEDVEASRVSVSQYTGAFQLHDVVPGAYTLRATQGKTSRGEIPVVVGAADVDGVELALVPAVDVKVVTLLANRHADALRAQGVEIEGDAERGVAPATAPMTVAQARLARGPEQPCVVSITSAGVRSRQMMAEQDQAESETGSNGETTFKGVLPGTYRVSFACFAGYITSARWGETDLLSNRVFTLSPGAVPAPIEVTARFGGGMLNVELKPEGSTKPEKAGVLLAPQFASAMGPIATVACAVQTDEAGASGSPVCGFGNLAPGHYMAYAFAKMNEIEFRNPSVLSALTGGAAVLIEDAKQASLTITRLIQ